MGNIHFNAIDPVITTTIFVISLQLVIVIKKAYDKYKNYKLKKSKATDILTVEKTIAGCSKYCNNIKNTIIGANLKCSCCDEEFDIKLPHTKCDNHPGYGIKMFKKNEHIYCKKCINSYMGSLLNQNKYDLRCMDFVNGCKFIFHKNNIRMFLDDINLKKFDELIKMEEVEKKAEILVNYQICPKCRMFGCVVSEQSKYYVCDECKSCWCKDCKNEFHSTDPCGVFSDITEEHKIRNFIREIMTETITHKCHKCDIKYVKIDGCNHITCPKCKAECCYICRTPYVFRTKQCSCKINGGVINNSKIHKDVRNKLKKLISANTNTKVKSIMIDEVEKQGYYIPFAITGNVFKSLKHLFFGLF